MVGAAYIPHIEADQFQPKQLNPRKKSCLDWRLLVDSAGLPAKRLAASSLFDLTTPMRFQIFLPSVVRAMCVCALGGMVATAAVAAPMQGELAASAASDGAAREELAGVSAVHTRPSSGSQTVDMLIELQPRNAGLTFNERTPAGERAVRVGLPLAERGGAEPRPGEDAGGKRAAVPEAPPSGLFGAGATPPVTSQQRMPSASAHAPVEATRAIGDEPQREGRSSSASHADMPGWLLWPRELIAFVRENRDWVIGGIVAILALSGGMSVLFGRQRRF